MNAKQKVRKEADKLWQKIITGIGSCELCGDNFALAGHHIIHKSQSSYLRYSIRNGICLCRKCHFKWHLNDNYMTTNWAKKNSKVWDMLESNRSNLVKTTIEFYRNKIEELKELLETSS